MDRPLWGLYLSSLASIALVASACEPQESKIERREHKSETLANQEINSQQSAVISEDASAATVDSEFEPIDPNNLQSGSSGNFPQVSFSFQGLPDGTSERNLVSATLEADATISHYAFKLGNGLDCIDSGGYRVEDVQTPLKLDLSDRENGPVSLCTIVFHFPSKSWQPLDQATIYSWEKTPFQRTLSTYYEYLDAQCGQTIRMNATLSIEGSTGTYTWNQVRTQGCPFDANTYVDQISDIKVLGQDMTGLWYEGEIIAGWFRFQFTDEARTAFTGKWGYGQLDGKVEGVWNSVPAQ